MVTNMPAVRPAAIGLGRFLSTTPPAALPAPMCNCIGPGRRRPPRGRRQARGRRLLNWRPSCRAAHRPWQSRLTARLRSCWVAGGLWTGAAPLTRRGDRQGRWQQRWRLRDQDAAAGFGCCYRTAPPPAGAACRLLSACAGPFASGDCGGGPEQRPSPKMHTTACPACGHGPRGKARHPCTPRRLPSEARAGAVRRQVAPFGGCWPLVVDTFTLAARLCFCHPTRVHQGVWAPLPGRLSTAPPASGAQSGRFARGPSR
jgi:hypothetical protein